MSRLTRVVVASAALFAALAPVASAHTGNPNFRSVFNGVSPRPVPGLQLNVLGYDQYYQLINKTGKVVVVKGYQGEPYARLLPDGTVELNHNSPATYLNEDRFATTAVPSFATAKARPDWRVIDRTGRFSWHDHRMHWMSPARPSAVKNVKQKTKIFNYTIPLDVGGRTAAIHGTLFWVGPTDSGLPIGAIVAFVVLVGAGIVLVLVVRRRRRSSGAGQAGSSDTGDDSRVEAW